MRGLIGGVQKADHLKGKKDSWRLKKYFFLGLPYGLPPDIWFGRHI
jgi:hypothetical protein